MDRLDAMRAFVTSVERGSLSEAARALRTSPASVTRAVASIEERLGAELLRRTTRSLKLTEAGERYLETARRVLAELDEAERTTKATRSVPHGVLAVTAPVAFGALHVTPIVHAFLAKYAAVRVRLSLLDRVVSVVEEGVDVAVRIAQLPDSALVAANVGEVRRVVVASPAYLARHGTPQKPADLAQHRCISLSSLTSDDHWPLRGRPVKVQPVLTVNLAEAAVESAIAGVGLACVLSYQAAAAVRAGKLSIVLAAHERDPLPVHVVHAASRALSANVRAFVDLAVPKLRAALR